MTVRAITFLPQHPTGRPDREYDITYQSLMSSPLPLRGSTERKLHGELVSRLEALGQPRTPLDGAGNPRAIRPDELQLFDCPAGGTLELSDPEYDFLSRHVNAMVDADVFPKAWSREGQALVDLLARAQ